MDFQWILMAIVAFTGLLVLGFVWRRIREMERPPEPGEGGSPSSSMSSAGIVEVVSYPGRTRTEAERAFGADRSEMASLGYEPTARRWSPGRPFVGRVDGPDLPVTSDSPDAGYLTVTYKWRSKSERGEAGGGSASEDV